MCRWRDIEMPECTECGAEATVNDSWGNLRWCEDHAPDEFLEPPRAKKVDVTRATDTEQ